MKLTPDLFVPTPGKMYAHLFENTRTGVKRNLYWNLHFDFQPFDLDGEEESPNCIIEWLEIPNPQSALSSKLSFSKSTHSDAEASCYVEHEHNEARNWEFSLSPIVGMETWDLSYEISLETGLMEYAVGPDLILAGSTSIQFDGIIIVKENLDPNVTSPEQARELLSVFFEAHQGLECFDEDWRFVFRPPFQE